jgi:hypothetical protein
LTTGQAPVKIEPPEIVGTCGSASRLADFLESYLPCSPNGNGAAGPTILILGSKFLRIVSLLAVCSV